MKMGFKNTYCQGAWVAQSIRHPALDFGSGLRSQPGPWDRAPRQAPCWTWGLLKFSLSLSLCPFSALSLSLSLKKKKKHILPITFNVRNPRNHTYPYCISAWCNKSPWNRDFSFYRWVHRGQWQEGSRKFIGLFKELKLFSCSIMAYDFWIPEIKLLSH